MLPAVMMSSKRVFTHVASAAAPMVRRLVWFAGLKPHWLVVNRVRSQYCSVTAISRVNPTKPGRARPRQVTSQVAEKWPGKSITCTLSEQYWVRSQYCSVSIKSVRAAPSIPQGRVRQAYRSQEMPFDTPCVPCPELVEGSGRTVLIEQHWVKQQNSIGSVQRAR